MLFLTELQIDMMDILYSQLEPQVSDSMHSQRLSEEAKTSHFLEIQNEMLILDLVAELQKNKSLMMENEALARELKKERAMRLQNQNNPVVHKPEHCELGHVAEAFQRELDALKVACHRIYQNLNHEEEVNHSLETNMMKLSVRLMTEINEVEALATENESLNQQLLEQQIRLEAQLKTHELEVEQLHKQLEEQRVAHHQEMGQVVKESKSGCEALMQQVDRLKEEKDYLEVKLIKADELSKQMQELSARLCTDLETKSKTPFSIKAGSRQEDLQLHM